MSTRLEIAAWLATSYTVTEDKCTLPLDNVIANCRHFFNLKMLPSHTTHLEVAALIKILFHVPLNVVTNSFTQEIKLLFSNVKPIQDIHSSILQLPTGCRLTTTADKEIQILCPFQGDSSYCKIALHWPDTILSFDDFTVSLNIQLRLQLERIHGLIALIRQLKVCKGLGMTVVNAVGEIKPEHARTCERLMLPLLGETCCKPCSKLRSLRGGVTNVRHEVEIGLLVSKLPKQLVSIAPKETEKVATSISHKTNRLNEIDYMLPNKPAEQGALSNTDTHAVHDGEVDLFGDQNLVADDIDTFMDKVDIDMPMITDSDKYSEPQEKFMAVPLNRPETLTENSLLTRGLVGGKTGKQTKFRNKDRTKRNMNSLIGKNKTKKKKGDILMNCEDDQTTLLDEDYMNQNMDTSVYNYENNQTTLLDKDHTEWDMDTSIYNINDDQTYLQNEDSSKQNSDTIHNLDGSIERSLATTEEAETDRNDDKMTDSDSQSKGEIVTNNDTEEFETLKFGSDVLLLQSPTHSPDILKTLLKMQRENKYCDFKFVTPYKTVNVHKLIILANSPSLFQNHGNLENIEELHFPEVLPTVLDSVVYFLYTGKLKVRKSEISLLKSFCETEGLRNALELLSEYSDVETLSLTVEQLMEPSNSTLEESITEACRNMTERLLTGQLSHKANGLTNISDDEEGNDTLHSSETKPQNVSEIIKHLEAEAEEECLVVTKSGRISKPTPLKIKHVLAEKKKAKMKSILTKIKSKEHALKLKKSKNFRSKEENLKRKMEADSKRKAGPDLIRKAGPDLIRKAGPDLIRKAGAVSKSKTLSRHSVYIRQDKAIQQGIEDDRMEHVLAKAKKRKTRMSSFIAKIRSRNQTPKVEKSKIMESKDGDVKTKAKTRTKRKVLSTGRLRQLKTKDDNLNTFLVKGKCILLSDVIERRNGFEADTVFDRYHFHNYALSNTDSSFGHNVDPQDANVITNEIESNNESDCGGKVKARRKKKAQEYHCHECGKSWQSIAYMRHHRALRHQDISCMESLKNKTCDSCGKIFGTYKGLARHLINQHGNSEPETLDFVKKLTCRSCGLVLQSVLDRIRHEKRQHGIQNTSRQRDSYKCNRCGKRLRSICNLKFHEFHHHGIVPKTKTLFYCQIEGCKYAGRDKYSLDLHQMGRHNKSCGYPCEICGKQCKSLIAVENHVRVNHTCRICKIKIGAKQELQAHMESEHSAEELKPLECEVCLRRFRQKAQLDLHLYRHHNRALPKGTMWHRCDKCSYVTTILHHLGKHRQIHEGSTVLVCEICKVAFPSEIGLQQHQLRIHQKVPMKVQRTKVQRTKVQKTNMQDKYVQTTKKQKTKALQQNSFQKEESSLCDSCSETFKHKHSLLLHMHFFHGQPLPEKYRWYKCDSCSYATNENRLLQKHTSVVHSGSVVHTCSVCKTAFKFIAHLKNHLHKHKGMVCPHKDCIVICDSKELLESHMNQEHVVNQERVEEEEMPHNPFTRRRGRPKKKFWEKNLFQNKESLQKKTTESVEQKVKETAEYGDESDANVEFHDIDEEGDDDNKMYIHETE